MAHSTKHLIFVIKNMIWPAGQEKKQEFTIRVNGTSKLGNIRKFLEEKTYFASLNLYEIINRGGARNERIVDMPILFNFPSCLLFCFLFSSGVNFTNILCADLHAQILNTQKDSQFVSLF
jgi:hypothetical protein